MKDYEKTVRDWEKAIEKNEPKKREKQRRKKSNPPLNMTVRWRGCSGKRKEWNGRNDDYKASRNHLFLVRLGRALLLTKFRTNPFPIHLPLSLANPSTSRSPAPMREAAEKKKSARGNFAWPRSRRTPAG